MSLNQIEYWQARATDLRLERDAAREIAEVFRSERDIIARDLAAALERERELLAREACRRAGEQVSP